MLVIAYDFFWSSTQITDQFQEGNAKILKFYIKFKVKTKKDYHINPFSAALSTISLLKKNAYI